MPLTKPATGVNNTFGFELEFVVPQTFNAQPFEPKSMDELAEYFDWNPRVEHRLVLRWAETNGVDEDSVCELSDLMLAAVGWEKMVYHIGAKQESPSRLVRDNSGKYYHGPDFHRSLLAMAQEIKKDLKFEPVVYFSDGADADKDYTSNWYLSEDISIQTPSEWDMGMELISPIFHDRTEFEHVLSRCMYWLTERGFKTNATTGLHINIGVDAAKLDPLKLMIFSGEDWLMKQFPRLLRNMTNLTLPDFIKSYYSSKTSLSDMKQAFRTYVKELDEKYWAINLGKLNSDNPYIEFRATGGADYHQKEEEIFDHLNRYLRLIEIASNPEAGKKDYAKKLAKLCFNHSERIS